MNNLIKTFLIAFMTILISCHNPVNSDDTLTNNTPITVDTKTYYTVTFMNGNTVYETQKVEKGQKASRPAINPTYNDCEFIKWEDNINNPIYKNTTIRAYYRYIKYEITTGTFVSNHRDKYSDDVLFTNVYYNNLRGRLFDDLMEDLIKKLKYFSSDMNYINHYETYIYYTLNIDKILDEIRNEPGSEIETNYYLYTIIFNHEGGPLSQKELYHSNRQIAGYTWIAVKILGSGLWYID